MFKHVLVQSPSRRKLAAEGEARLQGRPSEGKENIAPSPSDGTASENDQETGLTKTTEPRAEMSELSEVEKERLANIRERDELLRKLHQEALSSGLILPASPLSPGHKRSRKAATPHKRVKREPAESPRPTRSSARLRGLQADSEAERQKYEAEQEAVRDEERRRRMRVSGDLKVEDIVVGGTRWNNELKGLGISPSSDATRWRAVKEEEEEEKPPVAVGKELAEVRDRFHRLRVWDQWESTRVKITPERIYTMAFHPTEDKPVVFAGDKLGHLGILDASQTSQRIKSERTDDDTEDSQHDDDPDPVVTTIKPHSRTISSIFVHRSQPTKLYTASYDSSIRVLDLDHQTATEAYAPSDLTDEDPLSGVDMNASDPHVLYFTSLEGNFGIHDTRIRTRQGAKIFTLSDRKIGGFSLCPNAPTYFATASLDRYLRLWDLRSLRQEDSVPVGEHLSALSVSHAAFNASGQIATASYDNTLKVHDLAQVGILSGTWPADHTLSDAEMQPTTTIRHNCQTGRWVTILRPQWQSTPAANATVQRFSIGNMQRYVDVYSATGVLLARLGGSEDGITAVPAVTAMHPVRDWVVGGTASGRVGLWM
ncbi:hypothetical protein KEM52_005692 [Ascosphaera acerosa]|nr:hypothetical protein KEM52_005692 [Ascosphaera acerosa]